MEHPSNAYPIIMNVTGCLSDSLVLSSSSMLPKSMRQECRRAARKEAGRPPRQLVLLTEEADGKSETDQLLREIHVH